MREKSQIDDMRAAVRGDLERARARRGEDPPQQSVPQPPVVPEPDPDVVPTPEPEPAPDPDVLPEPDPEPVTPPDPAPTPEPQPEPEPELAEDAAEITEPVAVPPSATEPAAHKKTFFARLFGRG
jgi:outer membrane biosynthesis protein TonB